MRRFSLSGFLAALGATAMLASSFDVRAADLAPITKAPAAAVYSWTGFYLGANAGYGWASNTDRITAVNDAAGLIANSSIATSLPIDADGFVGGGQIGYNWQISPLWVVGLESDIAWTDLDGTYRCQARMTLRASLWPWQSGHRADAQQRVRPQQLPAGRHVRNPHRMDGRRRRRMGLRQLERQGRVSLLRPGKPVAWHDRSQLRIDLQRQRRFHRPYRAPGRELPVLIAELSNAGLVIASQGRCRP